MAERVEAIAVASEKPLAVAALDDQRMRQRQQHRGVGIGPDRDPFGPDCLRSIFADRADIDHPNAGRPNVARAPLVPCQAQPPLATWVFFGLAPPNITKSRVCRAIDVQEVSGPVTACALPRI